MSQPVATPHPSTLLVLGGAGMMAAGTIKDLVSNLSDAPDRILVADRDMAMCQALIDRLGGDARLEARAIDVADNAALAALLKGVEWCLNGVPTFAGHQMAIFEACLAAGCHYIDYGGMGVFTVKQKARHEAWRARGLTAILSLGSDPGLSNVLCRAVADRLDTIESINLYWAAEADGPPNPVLVPPYNVATVLAEYANPSRQFRGGRLIDTPPQSGFETLDLPAPWGPTTFMHTQHSEPLTVPFATGIKEKGIKEFTWKLHLPREDHDTWVGLVRAGFGDFDDPLEVGGARVKPADFLNALIARNMERNADRIPERANREIHFAIGRGTAAGKRTMVTCSATLRPSALHEGYVDAGTSMCASIGLQLARRVNLPPGVFAPEEVFDPATFFAELKPRGFVVTLTTETAETV
jgi:saccharopine dehydrogenase-like NADP-dependent oxidoreductase